MPRPPSGKSKPPPTPTAPPEIASRSQPRTSSSINSNKFLTQVAVQGSRILARLKVYEATARFQVVAEDAVRGHAEGTDPALRQVHMACGLAGKALSRLAHALLSCPSQMHAPRPSIIAAFSPEGSIPAPSKHEFACREYNHLELFTISRILHNTTYFQAQVPYRRP